MKLFHKYILKETLLACIAATGLFVFVLLAGNAIRDVADMVASGKMSFVSAIKILIILMPSVISYAMPLGVLTGVLITIGRLSVNNEILLMKASGISIYTISCPIILIAIVASVASIFINFYYSPIAYNMYKNSIRNVVKKNPLNFIIPNVFIDDFPGYVLFSNGSDGNNLSQFMAWQLADDNSVDMFVKAESCGFSYDKMTDSLLLLLKNGNGEKAINVDENIKNDIGQRVSTIFFDEMIISLPMGKLLSAQHYNKKMSHMTLNELLILRNSYVQQQFNQQNIVDRSVQKMIVQTQIQKNFVMSFCIFSLTLIAIPLGLMSRRKNKSFNTALALGLALGYYFIIIIISWMDTKYYLHPDILIWLPNIFLQIFGFSLIKKSAKH